MNGGRRIVCVHLPHLQNPVLDSRGSNLTSSPDCAAHKRAPTASAQQMWCEVLPLAIVNGLRKNSRPCRPPCRPHPSRSACLSVGMHPLPVTKSSVEFLPLHKTVWAWAWMCCCRSAPPESISRRDERVAHDMTRRLPMNVKLERLALGSCPQWSVTIETASCLRHEEPETLC